MGKLMIYRQITECCIIMRHNTLQFHLATLKGGGVGGGVGRWGGGGGGGGGGVGVDLDVEFQNVPAIWQVFQSPYWYCIADRPISELCKYMLIVQEPKWGPGNFWEYKVLWLILNL